MSTARVFISYRAKDPDRALAHQFFQALTEAGHNPFLAEESIRWGENWAEVIDEKLKNSDYFLLLLSRGAGESEMVIEEVRRGRQLQQTSADGRPHILPLRVMLSMNEPLCYDLDSYIGRIQQREWNSEDDTPRVLNQMLALIGTGAAPAETGRPPDETDAIAVETRDRPPLPAAAPELPDGQQVALTSNFYIERSPVEEMTFAEVRKPGALVCLKAPRQMGKTSLLARLIREARKDECRVVRLNLEMDADASIFSDLGALTRWFCSVVGDALDLENKVESRWPSYLTDKGNCNAYFRSYILRNSEAPVLVAVDKVDELFEHPNVVEEFFGMLRGWHEGAADDETWQKLRLVLVHSTEGYADPNINQSPLANVGLQVRLPEFDAGQVNDLVRRHGLGPGDADVGELMRMVGGHPYLIRLALYRIYSGIPMRDLLRAAPTEEGVYSDHLRRHQWTLNRNQHLAEAMRRVVGAERGVRLQTIDAFKLEGMGLVRLTGNDSTPWCELYRKYFLDRL